VQLVEQHRIDRYDPRWKAIDEATFASKNLYNAAMYVKRQAYIHERHRVISYADLDKQMHLTEEYRALPAKVAQWVLKQVCAAWDSYFAACAEWERHPGKFLGHPKLPKYLDKQGRNLLVYTTQAISRDPKNAGWIVPSQVPIRVATKLPPAEIAQVHLVPKATHFVVEVVYERPLIPQPVDPTLSASLDIGVNNLAAITTNKPNFTPRLVNGRPLKSLNQYYNKRRAKMQSRLPKDQHNSRALDDMTDARQRAIMSYLHTASRAIIELLANEGIGTLVIGKNVGWKQEANMGKKNNQSFVFIPHARFIDLLTYKAELVGIRVVTIEESHTSKCSFLDLEPIGHHDRYLGKRVKRGLFVASTGQVLNADVNGAYNILRRFAPDAFPQGIAACVLRPISLQLPDRRQDRSKQRVRRKASA
jgi:putative transposase